MSLFLISSFKDNNKKQIYFSVPSGFYEKDFYLEVTTDSEYELHYTTNGDDPTLDSPVLNEKLLISDVSNNKNVYSNITEVSYSYNNFYPELLDSATYEVPNHNINKCNVIKAAVFDNNGSLVASNEAVYFVGLNDIKGLENINIMSISTDSDNLFDYNKGIYVLGKTFYDLVGQLGIDGIDMWNIKANYTANGNNGRREANITLFDENRNQIFNVDGKIEISGAISRNWLPKSLNISSDKQDFNIYGYDTYAINLFGGGNDNIYKYKDYIVSDLLEGTDINIDVHEYDPCAMFLNGEYWGIYYLCDKFNYDYFVNKYNVDENNLIIEKTAYYDMQSEKYLTRNIENDKYSLFDKNYKDLSKCNKDVVLEELSKIIDLDNYLDYYSLVLCLNATDSLAYNANNIEVWKTRVINDDDYQNGKWRLMLYDLNIAIRWPEQEIVDKACYYDPTFAKLCENDEFKIMLINRVKYLYQEVFTSERIEESISKWLPIMKEPICLSNDRFFNTYSDLGLDSYLDSIRGFFAKRYDYLWEQFENVFGEEWLNSNGIQK